ncbi:MAG TPA: hypothetical protein VJM15_05465 [Sphingomicrobium sp.]|nr:hypothetical protein [Sphingomicrobium sp.]
MSKPPKTYRVYCFDAAQNTISNELLEAASDAQAIAEVEAKGFGSMCEIWDGDRLVARLEVARRQA